MYKFIQFLINFFMPPQPPTPVPVPPPTSKIDAWCESIKSREGYFAPCTEYPTGTSSFCNNNPGNINWMGQKNAVQHGRFARFDTYQHGYDALRQMLVNACTGKSKIYKPTMTLFQFYALYAPSSDNNDPNSYANEVAGKLGVSPYVQIQSLL